MNEGTAPDPGNSGPKPASATPFLVLHVNDNTNDQILFQVACQAASLPINWHVVVSAKGALSYLEHLIEQSTRVRVVWPHMVLLDIHLPPEAEGGFEVLRYLRSRPEFEDTRVVILSGLEHPRIVQTAYQLGANSFAHKPTSFLELVELVRSLHSRWAPSPSAGH